MNCVKVSLYFEIAELVKNEEEEEEEGKFLSPALETVTFLASSSPRDDL